jgi:hypothetical protein
LSWIQLIHIFVLLRLGRIRLDDTTLTTRPAMSSMLHILTIHILPTPLKDLHIIHTRRLQQQQQPV